MSDTGCDETPSPVATMIVRRQCFPRVPPELLLREHAERFRLTGLTLASLLSAVTPRVYDVLPPFVAQTDINGEVNHELIDIILKDMTKMPTVTREHIKETNITRKRMTYEEGKLKGLLGATKTQSSSLNNTAIEKEDVQNENVPFIFEEASPSRITATGIVRRKIPLMEMADLSAQSVSDRRLFTRGETALPDFDVEEREVLWGYDTGAVVHVGLRTFALDLQVLRQYETLLPTHRRRRCSSSEIQVSSREVSMDDNSGDSSRMLLEGKGSATKTEKYTEERDDTIDIMSERAPYGVSLLGYHPVGTVCCLVYDAANDLAISGGDDGSLLVWDLHQRYRAAYRERHVNDDELRQMRPMQQFSKYVKSRRLVQQIRHAHNGGISTLATHCELLLSGGVDGTVKVWSTEQSSSHNSFSVAPPQYIERQLFRCRGWVRHIWCAPERSVQGDDVIITSESGDITCLKGSTASQQPIVQTSRGRHKLLLDALRESGSPLSMPDTDGKRRLGVVSPPSTLNSLVRVKCNEDESTLPDLSPEERKAFRLLNSGVITRALRRTRTLQTISEEARLASSVGNRFSLRDESTSAITRIIPLVERNLFITVGYSSMVRFLDMNRRTVAGVVEHPSLTAASERGKRDGNTTINNNGNGTSNTMKKEPNSRVKSVQFKIDRKGTHGLCGSGNTSHGIISGKNEVLRFIDVLYVSSCDYLLLLDNRNTVFLWDYAENNMLTSWIVPNVNEGGKQNIALSLLPCGTRHYESGCIRSKNRVRSRTLYRPQRRVACYYKYTDETEESRMSDGDLTRVTRIPFFVVCSKSLELCDIVVESNARLEFQGHQDSIVGIFIRKDPLSSSPKNKKVNKEILLTTTTSSGGVTVEKSETFDKKTTNAVDVIGRNTQQGHNIAAHSRGGDRKVGHYFEAIDKLYDSSGHDNNTKLNNEHNLSLRFEKSLRKTEDSNRLRVLSCSVDGTICFWGNLFEPLRTFNHKTIAKENAKFCTTTTHKPVSLDNVISPFDAPLRILKDKKTGKVIEIENDGCDDTTSFYFSARWNFAITGHDDGSIRFWPCNQQLATFAWHKRIHRNAVSGLMEARIGRTEKQRRIDVLQGKSPEDISGNECIELLATVSYDGYLAVWERPETAKIHLYARTRVSQSELLCVAFDEMNQLFIVGDSSGMVSSWSARDLELRCKIPSRPNSPWRPVVTAAGSDLTSSGLFAPTAVPASNDGRSSESVKSTRAKRVGHTEAVTALLVDGNLVFSGGEDGRVFLWDLNFGVLIREYFLLHDTEIIAWHRRCRKSESEKKMHGTTMYSNETTSRTVGVSRPTTEMMWFPSENVTSLVLLKRRRGDFLVATREGWIYHFRQKEPYPYSTYEHNSSIRCMCVLQEGWDSEEEEKEAKGREDNVTNNSDSGSLEFTGIFLRKKDLAFEVAIGCENGKIAVIREAFFSATV
ncbi:WD40 repeat [Trypanosoma melophagium]|uniref:WD40 repeat n=1 Tax=Trypanosoma melophagium TaxID=715481 RepID=UPI00351A0159|nr:WD40 repeat [Trypanosoma melophagium]